MNEMKKVIYLGTIFWIKKITGIGHARGLFLISLVALTSISFAASGDMLEGTSNALVDTILKTGKIYIYLGELVVAVIIYIKSRNIGVFTGIIVIAFFLNYIMPKFLGINS